MSEAARLLDSLEKVLIEPSSNLTAAALLAAGATLLVLIVSVTLWLLIVSAGYDEEAEDGSKERRSRKRDMRQRPRTTGAAREPRPAATVSIVALIVASVVSSYAITTSDIYCVDACHSDSPMTIARDESPHAAVRCASCHEDHPLLAIPQNTVQRIGHAWAAYTKGSGRYTSGVAPDRCITCHREIEQVFLSPSHQIRMSHAEPLLSGMSCSDCHEAAGHFDRETSRAVSMSRCVPCHDGEQASSDCVTCHTGRPADVARETGRSFATIVPLRVKDCGGCHDQESCDACHGTRMPHSDEFIAGSHARQAGFHKKQTCYRCHEKDDCGACHGYFETAHGPEFVVKHKALPRDASCEGTCHKGHTGSMCSLCHDF